MFDINCKLVEYVKSICKKNGSFFNFEEIENCLPTHVDDSTIFTSIDRSLVDFKIGRSFVSGHFFVTVLVNNSNIVGEVELWNGEASGFDQVPEVESFVPENSPQ